MKKTLLICSLLCLLVAATSVAASGVLSDENGDAQTTDNATVATTTDAHADSENGALDDIEAPSDNSTDRSFTRFNIFGQPIGIYHIDWALDLKKISSDTETEKTDPDQPMILDVTLPLNDDSNSLQLIIGLDIQQVLPPTVTETPNNPPESDITTPTTIAPTTQKPTTVAPTTQKPTTVTPTTQTPTTQKPVTEAPVTTKKPITELGAIPTTVPAMEYTDEEFDLLARIIYCEAGGEEMEGMIAVGSVVLNRVKSSAFPDNIHDVIFQKGQFSPAGSGKIYRITPSKESREAARRVLEGERTDTRILYFRLSKYASKPWMNGKRTLIVTIDKQSFYS